MNPQDAALILTEAGWSEQRIAAEVGASQPTINRIKSGRQRASYAVGAALVELAAKRPAQEGKVANG
ncbi:MAG: helix-turn-helix domain-containing protein [Stenotrophomonas sp.]|uniref:hypothetical protein n=1 Tax=Stenotrophomonas sp. TaxID=69392 RepID=UPI0013532BAB|nr:hypothetical protein [Stenotrophomonas sp.]MTI73329.1 helix-turn-helix domain-containing protein [Stenotrophomonas sp.]